ncbi:MAG: type II toxin-antitoxin system VapC family toxin [Bifidobacteriaceae bacterium]|jgi:predicted nucleic acid-binding protein|nr:type II toxin-antitoxin system VapC family toxin [Bifidobacteriaceae bacterium]
MTVITNTAGLVADASVAAAWFLQDEATAFTDSMLARAEAEGLVEPALWRFELANVFLVCERRGRVDQSALAGMLALLGAMDVRVHAAASDIRLLHEYGKKHRLTAYDAAYLVTALQSGRPLATNDAALAAAARVEAVETLTEVDNGADGQTPQAATP